MGENQLQGEKSRIAALMVPDCWLAVGGRGIDFGAEWNKILSLAKPSPIPRKAEV